MINYITNTSTVVNFCKFLQYFIFNDVLIYYDFSCAQLREIMRLNLNSTEESDIKDECLDGIKVIIYIYAQ